MKHRNRVTLFLLGLGLVTMACSGSSPSGGNTQTGAGGEGAFGGGLSSGGTSTGTGGNASKGGSSSLGGSNSTGGSLVAGGKTSSGGDSALGGSGTSAGRSGTGSVVGTGGSPLLGGASGASGAGSGGKSAVGGTSSAGGATAGGATNTGGTLASGSMSGSGGAATGGTTGTAGATVAIPAVDWVGVVGTGQSLSVGTTPASTTTQPYGNLMLSLGGATVPGTGSDPWDSTLSVLKMVPLVEPLRALQTAFPSPYPGNLYGETLHAAMANEITRFAKAAAANADYVTAHTVVGESGKGIVALKKQTGSTTGGVGRAYAATLFEAGAINRLAKAAGKTYAVGVVVMTHGETDCSNATYKNELVQLMKDYNTDIAAITGQTYEIPMYLSQQHGCPGAPLCDKESALRPIANVTEWQLGVEHKGNFVCTGPKYQYPSSTGDGIHLNVLGYQMLGEKTAQVYYQRAVLGKDWQPLQPTSVERSGRVVTVHFHVPIAPLNWDTSFDAPAITEWKNGKGFELRTDSSNITISSVAISGDSVQITASSDLPTSGLFVGYALTYQGKQLSNHSRAVRWGQLRDSDPFTGATTKQANPNYCVSFETPVP